MAGRIRILLSIPNCRAVSTCQSASPNGAPRYCPPEPFEFPLGSRLLDVSQPPSRFRHRPGRQPRDPGAVLPVPKTGPTPLLGSTHQIGTQRVSLHIATDDQEMVVRSNRERLEAALVEGACAGAGVVGVPPLGMRDRDPAEVFGEFAIAVGARRRGASDSA